MLCDLKLSVKEELLQLKDLECGNPNCITAIEEKKTSENPSVTKKKKLALDILLGDDDSMSCNGDHTELEAPCTGCAFCVTPSST